MCAHVRGNPQFRSPLLFFFFPTNVVLPLSLRYTARKINATARWQTEKEKRKILQVRTRHIHVVTGILIYIHIEEPIDEISTDLIYFLIENNNKKVIIFFDVGD